MVSLLLSQAAKVAARVVRVSADEDDGDAYSGVSSRFCQRPFRLRSDCRFSSRQPGPDFCGRCVHATSMCPCYMDIRPCCPRHEESRSERPLYSSPALILATLCIAAVFLRWWLAPHHRLGLAGSAHDLGRAAAVGRCKDDFGAPGMLLRHVAIGHNRLKPTAIVRRDLDRNSRSHHESLNCFGRFGNRPIKSDH